jgi:DNA mismatch repair ATPase MutL
MSIGAVESVEMKKEDIRKLVPVGQFNNGFIICSKLEGIITGLYAVDQHAADERIRYEEISKKYIITSQKLMASIKLQLDAEQEEIFNSHEASIFEAGFKLRVDENDQLLLEAVPSFHGIECEAKGIFIVLITDAQHFICT